MENLKKLSGRNAVLCFHCDQHEANNITLKWNFKRVSSSSVLVLKHLKTVTIMSGDKSQVMCQMPSARDPKSHKRNGGDSVAGKLPHAKIFNFIKDYPRR